MAKAKKTADKKNKIKSVNDGGVEHGNQKAIADRRFARARSDPRFQTAPKKHTKVKLDSRFTPMLTDRRFASTASLDKRGKKKTEERKKQVNADLKHYYQKSEESESEDLEEERDGSGEGTASDSSTDDDMALVFEDDVPEIELMVEEEDVPLVQDGTQRLAVVNMDWRQVRAVDLYVSLRSRLPKGGDILSVSIYPSEFGLQRMEEEEVRGPVGLFDDENRGGSDDDDGDDEIDFEKVRDYEKSRLRYYYAVVECDSVSTANHIYEECDGFELEKSSNKLDLRFIPDSREFKHPPRDVATEALAKYEGLDFYTKVLQHTNIDTSWDEDDPNRIKTFRRHFNDDQLAELFMKEYLADDSDTDEEDNDDSAEDKSEKKKIKLEKTKGTYLPLTQSGDGSDGDDQDKSQDMEVTFIPGLEDSKHIPEKNKESKSVWDANQRKRREKKKSRNRKSQDSSDDYSSDGYAGKEEKADVFFVDEPSLEKVTKIDARRKGGKKGKFSADINEAKATTAELELLLADNDNGIRGYNLKPMKTKGKKGKEIVDDNKIPSVDLNDQRVSKVFSSPLFALDPTDPQFKRSAAYVRQMSQKQRKEDLKESPEEEPPHRPTRGGLLSGHSDVEVHHPKDYDVVLLSREKHELSALVKSIKRNSQRVQLSSEDQLSKKHKVMMLPRASEKIESPDPSYSQTQRKTNTEKKNKK